VIRVALAASLLACTNVLAQAKAPAAPASEDPAGWMRVKGARAERVAVPVFGGSLMLYRAGKRGAEPVILIHGLGAAAARDWAETVPALADGYDVYALDLPGFGASDKGNHLYSPSNYVRVLDALFSERLKRPANVVGHSMGGVIALAYAAAFPDRVRRLVVVDAAGVLHRSVYGEFMGRMMAERTLGADSPWLELLSRFITLQAENLPVKGAMSIELPQVRQRLLRGDPAAIAAMALVEHDLSRGLRAIKAPTLVVWSSNDRVAPLRTGQALAAVIPAARLALVGEAGHAPQVSEPARFNALLRDELRGRLGLKPYAQPLAPPASGQRGSCFSERGRQFSGDYEEIVLRDCADVEISDARIGKLLAWRSELRVVNSHVRDGVHAQDSRLEFTGGSVGGDPPLLLDETSVDAAALRFLPRRRVVATNYGDGNDGDGDLTLRLSVSEIVNSTGETRYTHQLLRLVEGQSWTPRAAR
jgi:pimeloyl-ACP methyl ester carboxylesterase